MQISHAAEPVACGALATRTRGRAAGAGRPTGLKGTQPQPVVAVRVSRERHNLGDANGASTRNYGTHTGLHRLVFSPRSCLEKLEPLIITRACLVEAFDVGIGVGWRAWLRGWLFVGGGTSITRRAPCPVCAQLRACGLRGVCGRCACRPVAWRPVVCAAVLHRPPPPPPPPPGAASRRRAGGVPVPMPGAPARRWPARRAAPLPLRRRRSVVRVRVRVPVQLPRGGRCGRRQRRWARGWRRGTTARDRSR